MLTVPEILAGLDDRFALVRSNERHLPERQRTLRGLLQGSYDLLDDTEKATFRCLGVFAGSFALRAASIVVTGGDDSAGSAVLLAADVPGLVWSLVDKSLVTIDQSVDGTRYRLLESVREFAFSLLVESGESEQAVLRAAQDLAARVGPWLPPDRTGLDLAVGDASGRPPGSVAVTATRGPFVHAWCRGRRRSPWWVRS